MDIPAELGTEVYAIDDGTVRIGGLYHSAYSDGVVQVDRRRSACHLSRASNLPGRLRFSSYCRTQLL